MNKNLPIVAIIGRPNVGKSTLFNTFVGERRAIVSDIAGTTRDAITARVHGDLYDFLLVDTAGLTDDGGDSLEAEIQQQAELALSQADIVIFMLDGRAELTKDDFDLAQRMRKSKTPLIFCMNKLDDGVIRNWDALQLGLGEPIALSALNYAGRDTLTDAIEKALQKMGFQPEESRAEGEDPLAVKIALIGRPNVGKSSLFNALIGKQRSVVSEQAGTTRDTIDTELKVDGTSFLLLDTAGLRRPGKIGKQMEFWSAVRTRHAIERSDVCAILIDSIDGVTHQDLSILGEAVEAGKGLILCVNKFDLARDRAKEADEVDTRDLAEVPMWGEDLDKIRTKYLKYLTSKVKFLPWVPVLFFSAKTGRGIKDLFKNAIAVKAEREKRISTAELNRILPEIFFGHVKPSVGTKMGKLKYCSQVTSAPPKFIFHVNNTEAFHFSYERYLENQLRERYGFFGTPIRVELRDSMEDRKKKK
jgi:GTP-binding protein